MKYILILLSLFFIIFIKCTPVVINPKTSAVATFTVTGDNKAIGQVKYYDLRYSLFELSDVTWGNATKAVISYVPKPAGVKDTVIITGLEVGRLYWFAIKLGDQAGNWSDISNVVSKRMDSTVNNVSL